MKRYLVKDTQGRTTEITGYEPSEFSSVSTGEPGPIVSGPDGMLDISFLKAFDKVGAIAYADAGLRTERISSITYTSSEHPSADILAAVSYLGVGTLNQRIDVIQYTGDVFGSSTLRKVFVYSLFGIKYRRTGFYYELI